MVYHVEAYSSVPSSPVGSRFFLTIIFLIIIIHSLASDLFVFFFIDIYPFGYQSITRAYGRVDSDGSRYLLSDNSGMLYLLVITHEKER